jgi:hypothetical protein
MVIKGMAAQRRRSQMSLASGVKHATSCTDHKVTIDQAGCVERGYWHENDATMYYASGDAEIALA